MPHGVINSTTSLKGDVWVVCTYPPWGPGGLYPDAGSLAYGKSQAPASTSNPVVHGFRNRSPWYRRSDRWRSSPGYIRYVNGPYLYDISGVIQASLGQPDYLVDPLNPSGDLYQDCLRTVLSKMVESDMQFNAFMIQGKEALKLSSNLASGLAGGIDRLMSAEFRKVRNWKKYLAEGGDAAISNFSPKFLEYLYGWKPLADDVENAFQMLLDGYTGPEQKRFRIRVSKSRKLQEKGRWREFAPSAPETAVPFIRGLGTANWETDQVFSRERRAKVVLYYNFPAQSGEMLPTMTPFSTAWELAPWSFVADWFIPIGSWVQAMEATQFAIYMESGVLTQSLRVASVGGSARFVKNPTYGGWTATQVEVPVMSGQTFYMKREILTAVQVLDRLKFPSFASRFGLPQAAQSLALLSQVLNKWFK